MSGTRRRSCSRAAPSPQPPGVSATWWCPWQFSAPGTCLSSRSTEFFVLASAGSWSSPGRHRPPLMEWSDERAELRLLKDSPNANDWRVRAQISLLDRAYPASTLAKALVRKVKRKMVGIDYRIEPAAIFGIVVFDRPDLDGGGVSFGQDYPRVLRGIGLGQCDRVFEFCAGPGYIGYSLLAHGFCKQLVLADVNPAAVQAARM